MAYEDDAKMLTNKVGKRIATALETIAQKDSSVLSRLDGTKKTYDRVMRRWFLDHGAENPEITPARLTELVDEWYRITKDEWDGWVDFYPTSVSAVSTGTKGGDNTDMVLAMSTDETAGRDDYAGHPAFACVDCNWQLDDNGEPQITAIEGITTNFDRYNVNRFVGVLQQSGYYYHFETETIKRHGYTVMPHPHNGMEAQAEAVKLDGTYRNWVVHGKYVSGLNGTKLTCCSGQKTAGFTSHNVSITRARAIGAKYSSGCACDVRFIQEMFQLMAASLTADGILQGCCSNNTRKNAAIGETGVNRVLLTSADAVDFEIGMTVMIGTNASSDRGTASTYSISGQMGRTITDIQTVTVENTDYKAIIVDGETFDTVAASTQIITFMWPTGTTDNVLGNNGSYKNNTSGKYAAKIQGVEYMVGCYEGCSDSIVKYWQEDGKNYAGLFVAKEAAKQATSFTNDHADTGLKVDYDGEPGWHYVKDMGYGSGCAFPNNVTGGSSSTYYRDAYYMESITYSASPMYRAFLCFGHLGSGAAIAGLSCAHVHDSLSYGIWYSGARLSPNGNRGEA